MLSALTLLLLLSVGFTQAAVHRIAVTHHRLPSGDEADVSRGMNSLATTDIATTEPFNTTSYGYALAGNISLGSPAQEFTVKFDFYSPNLYVIDRDAQYSNSYSKNTNVTGKQTYDPSATNSLLVVNVNFSSNYNFLNGSVVSDLLTVGDSLEAAVMFMDTTLVKSYMKNYPYDGTFGLSSVPAKGRSTTLLDQLQYSFDSPAVTLSLDSCFGTDNCTGQLTLGGLASDICQGNSWAELTAPVNTSSPSAPVLPVFNVTGASTMAVGDSNGCAQRVDIPLTVYASINTGTVYTSYQVHELFVQASNATFNRTSRHYELTDDQVADAQPVNLHMDNGAAIHLFPEDYTRTDATTGKRILNVYGYYNAHEYGHSSLTLSLSFLSHHCLSKNFHTGVWSITDRVSSA
jgi:hypothetical protein